MSTELKALLDAMQARCDAATEGPWEWRNSNGDPMLLSRAKGHYLVMGFRRMGMQGAQPVFRDRKHPGLVEEAGRENLYDFPDAELIAAARTDLPRLIAAVRAVLERIAAMEREGHHLRLHDHTRATGTALIDAAYSLRTALSAAQIGGGDE